MDGEDKFLIPFLFEDWDRAMWCDFSSLSGKDLIQVAMTFLLSWKLHTEKKKICNIATLWSGAWYEEKLLLFPLFFGLIF